MTSTKGTVLVTGTQGFTKKNYLMSLQNQLAATDPGSWMKIDEVVGGSLEFLNDSGLANKGNDSDVAPTGSITSFSASIMVSNAQHQPPNTIDGPVVGSAVTALGFVALPMQARWIKVKVTAITVASLGTLGVRLHAQTY